MKGFFDSLSPVLRKGVCGARVRVLLSFSCIVLASLVLLSNCDMMGGSIKEFISYNTDVVSVSSVDTPENSPDVTRIKDAWLFNPTHSNLTPGRITFYTTLHNPQDYDLEYGLDIERYIDPEGKIETYPKDWPISIERVADKADTLAITIGEQGVKEIQHGDAFKVALTMALKDGTRIFEPHRDIKQLIYDTKLFRPSALSAEKTSTGDYARVATWETQGETLHKGINRIQISFQSYSNEDEFRDFEYRLQNDGRWELVRGTVDELQYYQYLTVYDSPDTPGFKKFDLPFPFVNANYQDDAEFFDNYQFIVTIYDKNGLVADQGKDAHPATYLEDLEISYRYRNESNFRVDTDWTFRKNVALITRTVPNNVESVRFRAIRNDQYPNQEISWGGSIIVNEDPYDFSVQVGKNSQRSMTVSWLDDGDNSDATDPELMERTYKFTFIRLQPNKDSTLQDLAVLGQSGTGTFVEYPVVGGFEKPNNDNSSTNDTIKFHYTVNVPSSVDTIRILGKYLNTSTIFNHLGSDNGKPNIAKPADGFLNYPDSDELDYYDYYEELEDDTNEKGGFGKLNHVWDGWEYKESATGTDLKESGTHTFQINVKSELDLDNGAPSKSYIITVIKADPEGNPNVKLDELSISSASPDGTFDQLGPSNNANTFSPDILNYTVLLPNSTQGVILNAKATEKARIYMITSTTLETSSNQSVNTDDLLGYSDLYPLGEVKDLNINFPTNVIKKRVTLTLNNSSSGDTTPKYYTLTLIRCLPKLNTPTLFSDDGRLELRWTLNSSDAYEIRYNTTNTNSALNIPELAMKWKDEFKVVTSTVISGLTNYSKYNVWIRGKTGDRPGEWTLADVTGNYGIPGPAELASLTPSPSVGSLSPSFSAATTSYTLTIPSATSSLNFTAVKKAFALDAGTANDTPLIAGSPPDSGKTSTYTITAYPPDGNNVYTKEYKVNVIRLLPAPANVTIVTKSQSIDITNWDRVTNADYYEIYYGTSADIAKAHKWGGDIPESSRPGSGSTITIPGLSEKTEYHIWVRPKNTDTGIGEEYYGKAETKDVEVGITITDGTSIPKDYVFGDLTSDFTLYWSKNTNLLITALTGASKYEWYIDGVLDPDKVGNTLSVNAWDFSIADHNITVKITIDGNVYSKTIHFKVEY